MRFFEGLRTLDIATFILAHTAKNQETKSIFGSVFNHNLSRSVWEVKSRQEESAYDLCPGFFQRKNNLGRLQPSFGLQLTFPPEDREEEQGIRIRPYDLEEDSELSQSLPLRKRIIPVLKRGAQSITGLSEALGISSNQIKARLYEGQGKDFMKVSGKGQDTLWGLKQK